MYRNKMKLTYLLGWLIMWYLGLIFFSKNRNETRIIRTNNNMERNLDKINGKVLTIFTTFEDIKNSTEDEYRMFVQYNFLSLTQFQMLRENTNFVIYTNSRDMSKYIEKYYPNVILKREPKTRDFSVSMLKHLFLDTMRNIHTPFYMYTNGDILYNRNLIQTVRQINLLVENRLIRNKLLIIGRRLNHKITRYVNREKDIESMAKLSRIFIKEAQDYFIVTRNAINWVTFPEYLVGRSGYDNAIVDFAFRNEIELIDATNTITAVHQSNAKGEFLWMNHNRKEHDWNAIFWAPKIRHSSTEDARYFTNFTSTGEIVLFDKVTNSSFDFDSVPDAWVNSNINLMFDPSHNAKSNLGKTKLTVIILAFNRPESLRRLLVSLRSADFGKDRIDLKVHLDIDNDNRYDLECLRVLYTNRWNRGSYNIHKHTTHQGSLNQWIGAVDSKIERALILEDSVIVSKYFYKIIKEEMENNFGYFTGISLEPSFVTKYKHKSKPSLFFNFSSRILSLYRKSRAFIPNPVYWKYFLTWVKKMKLDNSNLEVLKNAPAYQHHFHGYYTNWYEQEISVWFSFYSEFIKPLSTSYIGDVNGYLASPHYFDSKWNEFYTGEWYTEYLLLNSTQTFYKYSNNRIG